MVAVGLYCAHPSTPTIVYIQDPNYVQPPCEAQRRLKEQGLYNGKIDNIWGPESDKAFCNYCAIREIESEYKWVSLFTVSFSQPQPAVGRKHRWKRDGGEMEENVW